MKRNTRERSAKLEEEERAKRARLGLHLESDAGEDSDADQDELRAAAAAGEAAAAALDGTEPCLSRLDLVRRRLARTREALSAYTRVHWRLLERLREHHRRFVLRHGHVGTKDAAAAVASAREAAGLPEVCIAAVDGPCTARPLPLSHYCVRHILLDPAQVLYVADESGAPRLRTKEDPPPVGLAPPPPLPAHARVPAPVAVAMEDVTFAGVHHGITAPPPAQVKPEATKTEAAAVQVVAAVPSRDVHHAIATAGEDAAHAVAVGSEAQDKPAIEAAALVEDAAMDDAPNE